MSTLQESAARTHSANTETQHLLNDIDASLTRLLAERAALHTECIEQARILGMSSERELSLRGQLQRAINASTIDSLDDCVASLKRVSDYLDNRDDCYDDNIDKATDALFAAIRRIQCRAEEIDDEESGDGQSEFEEMKRDDNRARIADIRAEQRRG